MRVGGESGFVMVSSLWALAIVLLIAAGFDGFVERKIEQATLLEDNLRRRLDEYATQQTVTYILTTQRYTRAGLTTRREAPSAYRTDEGHYRAEPIGGELWLDGTLYTGVGSSCFAIQDQAGLVGLGSTSASDLRWLLSSMSSRRRAIDELIDNLLDYVDENDRESLNGAEHADYRSTSLPLPSNYFLRSPGEVFRVMGWSEWLEENPDFLWWRWLSIGRSSVINPNTLPPSLVLRLPGADKSKLELVVRQRRQTPYRSVDDLDDRAGLRLDWPSEKFRFLASDRVQLYIRSRESRRLRVVGLELTPSGLLGPLQKKYEYESTPLLATAGTGARVGSRNGDALGAPRVDCKESAVRLF